MNNRLQKSKRVLLRPCREDWGGNRLFTHGTSYESVYRDAFAGWKALAEARGFQLDTWDQAPLQEADVLWFLDLPPTRKEFEWIKASLRPDCRLVLQVLETPVLSWSTFGEENRKHFDAVVTYEHPSAHCGQTRSRQYHYRLPNSLRPPSGFVPFANRKGLIALNSNRVEGFWGIRQPGWAGLPLVGRAFSGWRCTWADLRASPTGELYSVRQSVLRLADESCPGFVDIFGGGWNGEQISWCPYYSNWPYTCWRGKAPASKTELSSRYRFVLAFENFRGSLGYISEKLFDALSAGSVPVYLGDERITELVPSDAFVDVRGFSSYNELLKYLVSCPEMEWLQMREAGQAFLESPAFLPFSDKVFGERMLSVVLELYRQAERTPSEL